MVLKNIVVVGALLGVEAAQEQSRVNLKAMLNAKRATLAEDDLTEERDEDTELDNADLDDKGTDLGEEDAEMDETEKRVLGTWKNPWNRRPWRHWKRFEFEVATLYNYPCTAKWATTCSAGEAGTAEPDKCTAGKSRDIQGRIRVKQEGDFTVLNFKLKNLEAAAIGGIHVHEGSSCDDATAVLGHWWNKGNFDDPWFNSLGAVWKSDENGDVLFGKVRAKTGLQSSDVVGRAIVIHDSDGTRIACGLIEPVEQKLAIGTEKMQVKRRGFGVYPGYTASSPRLRRGSRVSVRTFFNNGYHWQRFCWNLRGLEKKTEGGIHIHAGYSCADKDLVFGHHWNKNSLGTDDAWTPVKWNSDHRGRAKGCATVKTDLDASKIAGRAVVVHAAAGARMACGIIEAEGTLNMPELVTYPDQIGYPSTIRPKGSASFTTVKPDCNVAPRCHAYQLFNYQLQGPQAWHQACSDDTLDVTKFEEIDGVDLDGVYAVRGGVAIKTSSETVYSTELSQPLLTPPGLEVNGHDYSDVGGFVTVFTTTNAEGKSVQQFSFGLTGLPERATQGGIHIHAGTSCASPDSHYWNEAELGSDDRWIPVKWKSDTNGVATGIVEVVTDIAGADIAGKVVVVHAEDNSYAGTVKNPKVMCGVLNGGLNQFVQKVDFRLYGLKKNAAGGIHIHDEPICDRSGGGHYWNAATLGSSAVEYDRWKPVKWHSDAQGRAFGSYYVVTDISRDDVAGKSVYVHSADGGPKLTCGKIYPDFNGLPATPGKRCGMHIHEGNGNAGDQCSNAAGVLGHYWDKNGDICDDWQKMTYRVKDYGPQSTAPRYRADSDDNVDSTNRAQPFAVSTNHDDMENRPIVVHIGSPRVACGTIEA